MEVITIRDLKVRIGFNLDNKIVSIEPVNKALGKAVEVLICRMRVITDDEEYCNIEHLMQEGGVYKRNHGRLREIR